MSTSNGAKKAAVAVAQLYLGKLQFKEEHRALALKVLQAIEALPEEATELEVVALVERMTNEIIDAPAP